MLFLIQFSGLFKGIICPKINIYISFAHPQAIEDVGDLFSSVEHLTKTSVLVLDDLYNASQLTKTIYKPNQSVQINSHVP